MKTRTMNFYFRASSSSSSPPPLQHPIAVDDDHHHSSVTAANDGKNERKYRLSDSPLTLLTTTRPKVKATLPVDSRPNNSKNEQYWHCWHSGRRSNCSRMNSGNSSDDNMTETKLQYNYPKNTNWCGTISRFHSTGSQYHCRSSQSNCSHGRAGRGSYAGTFDILAIKSLLWIQVVILLLFLPSPGCPAMPSPSDDEAPPPPRTLPLYARSSATVTDNGYSSSIQNLSSLTAGFTIPKFIPSKQTLGGFQSVTLNNNMSNLNFNSNPNNAKSVSLNSRATSTSRESGTVGDEYPFENNTYSNTTVLLGDTAFLKCVVKNLGDRSVYWIRRRDLHIISVDKNIYSNDGRFQVIHTEGSEEYTLQIKFVQKRDNGTYECQVSTGKGIASYAVHVFVAVPEAFILGNGEYHIQEGSTINLVCIVEKSPKPPEYIFWYQNDRMINYDKDRNLRIQTETGSKTHSRLIIDNAQVKDSGNYSCHVSNADPASTLVYISQGDKMAAIQRRKSAASTSTLNLSDYFPFLHQFLFTFILVFH